MTLTEREPFEEDPEDVPAHERDDFWDRVDDARDRLKEDWD